MKILFALGIIWLFIMTPISASSFNSRPVYLVGQNDVPKKQWPVDVDYKVDNNWYIGFKLPYGAYISIETSQYTSTSSALAKVSTENDSALEAQSTGQLFYAFPNFRFDLSSVSSGFAWEIKSPCCYSRGVSFALGTTYINIFGSQQSKWPDVEYIFNKQVVKLEQYYNIPVSSAMVQNITNYEKNYLPHPLLDLNSSQLAGIFFIILVPAVAVATVAYAPLKKKLTKK